METRTTQNAMREHVVLMGRYDDLDWESDPDTNGGLVSTEALDGAEARAIVEHLALAGYAVSTAIDAEDRGRRWIYIASL